MSKYKIGETIDVTVTGIAPYGIFIKTDDDFIGLIHISEVSNSFVKDLNEYARIGSNLNAKILDIDEKEKKLILSIKDFNKVKMNCDRQSIIETENGFKPLKNQLDIWIQEKISELNR